MPVTLLDIKDAAHEYTELPLPPIEKWMFLPTLASDYDEIGSSRSSRDFDYDFEHEDVLCPLPSTIVARYPQTARGSSTADGNLEHLRRYPVGSVFHQLPTLSGLSLSSSESHLWAYFHNAIAPSCVLGPARNPYQDIILRIAASAGRTSPLFRSIMAISASQLYILGHNDFYEPSWSYRQIALRSLRQQTNEMKPDASD